MIWLHRYAVLVACATVLLLMAGGLVTSTGSGLAVPDWPTTYGWSMFTFPLSKMVGGIFFEHGHRLVASTVGILTIILAVWLWWRDPRPWMTRLGLVALAAVVTQGVLGGITVLYFLPAPVSIAHAGLAQVFFCLTVSLAVFTSADWRGLPPAGEIAADGTLRRVAAATTALVYVQILLGATMRHTGAGLAIPDFPFAFGQLVPPQWTTGIAVHFAHRVGALVVLAGVGATARYVWTRHRRQRNLIRSAALAVALCVAQVGLGALTVLSGKAVPINTAHVVTGALLLASSLVLTLEAYRPLFRPFESRAGRALPETGVPARSSLGARA